MAQGHSFLGIALLAMCFPRKYRSEFSEMEIAFFLSIFEISAAFVSQLHDQVSLISGWAVPNLNCQVMGGLTNNGAFYQVAGPLVPRIGK